jgi:hypothetical protein
MKWAISRVQKKQVRAAANPSPYRVGPKFARELQSERRRLDEFANRMSPFGSSRIT